MSSPMRPQSVKKSSVRRGSIKHLQMASLTIGATVGAFQQVHVDKKSAKDDTRRRSSVKDGSIVTESKKSYGNDTETSEREKRKMSKQLKKQANRHRKALFSKFRVAARTVIHCRRMIEAYSLKNKEDDEVTPFIREMQFYDTDIAEGEGNNLMFDPRKFKANRSVRIPEETKRVLIKPPHVRTAKEIHYTMLSMRNLRAFGDYPVHMQRRIIETGTYEKYESKRLIVRQGHRPAFFYFVLSGSVVVMIMNRQNKTARPVAYLHKGDAFGELAILNNTTRFSTVISKESIELFSISMEDFQEIFMAGGVTNLSDPCHEDYIGNLEFLKGWPLEKLADQSGEKKKVIFGFFRNGDILVKDSTHSDWIILVKSGSIDVLKKLKRVEPYEWKKQLVGGHPRTPTPVHELKEKKQRDLRDTQRRQILPEISIPLKKIERIKNPDDSIDAVDAVELANTITTESNKNENSEPDRKIRKISKASGSHVDTKNTKNKKRANAEKDSDKTDPDEEERQRKRQEEQFEMGGAQQEVKTLASQLDDSRFGKEHELTEADLDPEFVQIQTISKGETFGLPQLIFPSQPSLCVVSNGAECILISKQLYMASASAELRTRLRKSVCPYPTDDELQESLQVKVDWGAYKSKTLTDALKFLDINKNKSLNARF
ncbi:unnamed protein product [Owenia fusiformis]|uniref:Cyclic nucleotide-binding domain-containing protein n=1 Tax=Owenia fusiformis TaxID=6347 RepID=A0A8S4NSS9_OWEFU|nr:unnamed protein product [Owenia fusiformis]